MSLSNINSDDSTPPDATTAQLDPNDQNDVSFSNININFSTPPDTTTLLQDVPLPAPSQNNLPSIDQNIEVSIWEGETEEGGEKGENEEGEKKTEGEKTDVNREEEVEEEVEDENSSEKLNEVRGIESKDNVVDESNRAGTGAVGKEIVGEDHRMKRRSQRPPSTAFYNEEEMAQRATSSQEDGCEDPLSSARSYMVMKTTQIHNSLANFTSKREKPKNKGTQLNIETITHGVFKTKCGFVSTRPLIWAESLEDLLRKDTNSVEHRWDYLCDSEDKIFECQVKVFHPSSSRRTLIEIRVITGVVLISGNNYLEWVYQNFPPWMNLVNNHDRKNLSPQLELPSKAPVPLKQNSPNLSELDHKDELAQLWEENAQLKTAVSTLETTVNDLRADLLSLTETVKNQHSALENMVKQTNIAWDEKLVGFLDSADKTSRKIVEQSKRELRKEMEQNKSSFRTELQSLMDKRPPEPRVTEHMPPDWNEDIKSISDSCRSANEAAKREMEELVEQSKRELRMEMEENKSFIRSELHSVVDKRPSEPRETEYTTPKWKEDLKSISETCRLANEAAMREIEEMRNNINRANRLRDSPHSPREIPSGKKRIALLTDSNGKRLDRKKFCQPVPLKDVVWNTCYTLDQVEACLESLKDTEIDMLVICCGTNDIDTTPGVTVAERLVKLIHQVKLQHPDMKIVVSETTPRQYDRDDEIKLCNAALHAQLVDTPNVAIAVQSRLRDSNWALYEDNKHILRSKINVYAGNIKSAMREVRSKRGNLLAAANTSTTTNLPQTAHPQNSSSRRHLTNTTSIPDAHYNNVAPLMSQTVVPPRAHFHGHPHKLNPLQQHHTPQQHHTAQQHHTSASSSMPPTSVLPSLNTTPIQDRLRRISQTDGPPDGSKMRETLITKLGDILKCLQSSAVSF